MSPIQDDWFIEQLLAVQSRLYRYIASLVPSRADAEDLFQRTSLTAWQERAKFDRDRDFFAWVCGVARNHVRRYYRERSKSGLVLDPQVADQLAERMIEEHDLLEQRQEALERCLDKLSPEHRQLIQDFYRQEGTVKDFAGRLGRTVESVYKALQRIRASLNTCVDGELAKEGSG